MIWRFRPWFLHLKKINLCLKKFLKRKNTSQYFLETNLSNEKLLDLKEKRILEKKLEKIVKEFAIFSLFFIFIIIFAYKSVSLSSLQFNYNFQDTFVKKQNKHETGLNEVYFYLHFCSIVTEINLLK